MAVKAQRAAPAMDMAAAINCIGAGGSAPSPAHPLDEELVNYYLRRKVLRSRSTCTSTSPGRELAAVKSFSPSRDGPGAKEQLFLFTGAKGPKVRQRVSDEPGDAGRVLKVHGEGSTHHASAHGCLRRHKEDARVPSWPRAQRRAHGLGHALVSYTSTPRRHGCHPDPGKSFSPSTSDSGAKVVWYLFVPRGRKYPTGLRMERATLKGFWKSTGKDRPVMHNGIIVGMKKTLVFHTGRAPSGTRTDWVMHEYRLHSHRNHHIQDTYVLCRVFNKNMVSPSTSVSGDADADNDLMQSVLGGIGTDMDPIQVESKSDGADANKDLMQPTLGGGGIDKDLIHVEFMSDDADTGNDMVQFAFGGVGTDKNPIQVESEVDGVDTDKGEKQFLTDGDDTGNEEMQVLTGGANKDKEGMQPVTGGASEDEDNSDNSWYTRYLAEEDNSWMQFPTDDVWYTSDNMGMIP